MRRPSLQFYPADWQANPKLKRCSHAEKGLWLDVLCILHDQDEYGIVRWPLREIALAVHARPSALQSLVEKGILKGADADSSCAPMVYVPRHGRKDGEPVTLIGAQQGPIWYSSRMVRDEYIRQVRAANEPTPKPIPKVAPKAPIGAHPTSHPSRAGASSSPSSSSAPSKEKKKEPSAFAEFMKFLSHKIGNIPNPPKEGVSVRWLIDNGYDYAVCCECWEYLNSEGWRTATVTWTTVRAEIGGWLAKGKNNGKNRSVRETASDRNVRNIKESLEYLDDLSDRDRPVDLESPTRLLTTGT